MFQVNHITKRYGRLLANDDVSLCVPDGNIAVLLGPNGAGKSTLIKCLVGLLRFGGEVDVDGYPNKSAEARRRLGYVPEMPAVYDLLTVGEHLEFIARAYRLDGWEDYGESLLSRMELLNKRDKLGKELSKGMQQKLSICCALLHRPRAVVFDEPMVGLDPHAIRELKEIFAELRDEGASLLVSTHMLDSVESTWDTAYILKDGRIAAQMENVPGAQQPLEDLYFSITEGAGENA